MQTKINVVLLIDDSAVATSRLMSMLKESNSSQLVLHAAGYREALNMMNEFRPDYVVLDIGLSEKTGIALLEEITSNHKDSKVVVITNFANPQYRNFCEQMGVNYFLDKSGDYELIPEIFSNSMLN